MNLIGQPFTLRAIVVTAVALTVVCAQAEEEVRSRGLTLPSVSAPPPPAPPASAPALPVPAMYALTIRPAGDGSGKVPLSPAAACPPACSAQYPQGTPVALAPVPAPGSTFAGWTGDCQGTGPCTLRMDRSMTAEARFTKIPAPASTSSSTAIPMVTPAAPVAIPIPYPVAPARPQVRSLNAAEISLAKTVFYNTINYDMVKVTDTLGLQERPWTSNTPPFYTLNVGAAYPNLTADDDSKRLLIHELAHVWQGQHRVPFTLNSAAHQSLSAITNGGDVASAYSYTVGKPWNQYNAEQQASIVAHWFTPSNLCFKNGPCGGGMKTTDPRYQYIRDHIRMNKPS